MNSKQLKHSLSKTKRLKQWKINFDNRKPNLKENKMKSKNHCYYQIMHIGEALGKSAIELEVIAQSLGKTSEQPLNKHAVSYQFVFFIIYIFL